MPALLSLSDVKMHCRIEQNNEDALLNALIATATAACANYLNVESLDDTAAPPIKSAALMMIADLYENREAQTERKLQANDVVQALLNPHRVHS